MGLSESRSTWLESRIHEVNEWKRRMAASAFFLPFQTLRELFHPGLRLRLLPLSISLFS